MRWLTGNVFGGIRLDPSGSGVKMDLCEIYGLKCLTEPCLIEPCEFLSYHPVRLSEFPRWGLEKENEDLRYRLTTVWRERWRKRLHYIANVDRITDHLIQKRKRSVRQITHWLGSLQVDTQGDRKIWEGVSWNVVREWVQQCRHELSCTDGVMISPCKCMILWMIGWWDESRVLPIFIMIMWGGMEKRRRRESMHTEIISYT